MPFLKLAPIEMTTNYQANHNNHVPVVQHAACMHEQTNASRINIFFYHTPCQTCPPSCTAKLGASGGL